MFKFAALPTGGGPAKKKPNNNKKKKTPTSAARKKKAGGGGVMRGGADCSVASMFFEPSTQASQWVAGIPFLNSGDASGNQNPVLSAFGSAESVVPYRSDLVMYTGSGISAPMGTPFSTGAPWLSTGGGAGGRRRPPAAKKLTAGQRAKTATKKKNKKKTNTPAR
jgi:hypothetical protein